MAAQKRPLMREWRRLAPPVIVIAADCRLRRSARDLPC